MEASVATADVQAPPEPEVSHDGRAEATRSTEELFQWSGYVHLGTGAEECEHSTDGKCEESGHFHAWVCLPNALQARDLADKSSAAKARKIRALRDPESDAYAVLEAELEEVRLHRWDELLESLANRRIEKLIPEFVHELSEDDRFEHYAQDSEEFKRLRTVSEEERDDEEFERLQADMTAYAEAFQEKVDTRTKGEIEALKQLPVEKVIEEQRQHRIEEVGTEQYLWTWYVWARFICTRDPTMDGFPSKRKFASPEALQVAPPEVVDAIREKIRDLETRTSVRGDAAGNS